MMSSITIKQIELCYECSKSIYSGEKTKKECLDILENLTGMKRPSAIAYINAYLSMRSGDVYKRTINEVATKYYLEGILTENGIEILDLALQSVEKHIVYYSKQGKGKLVSIQKISEEFKNKLNL